MSADNAQQRLVRALYRIGRALARIVIRHGLSAKDVQNIFKKAFVDVAREDYGLNGRPTNKARVATLTGLTRVEVARLVEQGKPGSSDYSSQHPLRKLVERWLCKAPWADPGGKPKALQITGGPDSFEALVADCGGDIAWQTLLKELVRMGVAQRSETQVKLLQHGFMPAGQGLEAISFMGEDVASLLSTFDWNLHDADGRKRFQRAANFVALDDAGWALLNQLAERDGQALLERIHEATGTHQLTDAERSSAMTGLGIYVYRVDNLDGEQE